MHRIVIVTLGGVCAGFLAGGAGSTAAHAQDDWQSARPFLWDGLQPFSEDRHIVTPPVYQTRPSDLHFFAAEPLGNIELSDGKRLRLWNGVLDNNGVQVPPPDPDVEESTTESPYVIWQGDFGPIWIGDFQRQDGELADRERALDDREADLRQQAFQLAQSQRGLEAARQQVEQARRELQRAHARLENDREVRWNPPEPPPGPDPHHPPPPGNNQPPAPDDRQPPMHDAHHPPPPDAHQPPGPDGRRSPMPDDQRQPPPRPGMEMLQHIEFINAMAERLGNPHTAAMLGISMAKEHLKPEPRFELLTGVLKEVDGPADVRNAAYLVLIETCQELGRDEEGRRLLSAMIVENAKKAKQKD